MAASDCFEVRKTFELVNVLRDHEKDVLDFDQQLIATNKGFIYILDSGEIVFIPNSMSDNDLGIIFSSEECYTEILKSGQYPIENPIITIFEREKEYLLKLNLHDIHRYRQHINTRLSIEVGEDSYESIIAIRDAYHKKIGVSNFSAFDYLSFYMVIGNYLTDNHGKWILLKEYGLYNFY